jgi:hypothetical protein
MSLHYSGQTADRYTGRTLHRLPNTPLQPPTRRPPQECRHLVEHRWPRLRRRRSKRRSIGRCSGRRSAHRQSCPRCRLLRSMRLRYRCRPHCPRSPRREIGTARSPPGWNAPVRTPSQPAEKIAAHRERAPWIGRGQVRAPTPPTRGLGLPFWALPWRGPVHPPPPPSSQLSWTTRSSRMTQ